MSIVAAVFLGSAVPVTVRADQVEMRNGDRYVGRVLSLNSNTLVLHNEILGTVQLPRGKVTSITLGASKTPSLAATPASSGKTPPGSAAVNTNANIDLSTALRQLGAHTNLIQQVQARFLGGAGTAASQKFNELLGGLMSGKITVADLRVQAKTAADQLRALKQDLGDDAGPMVDSYLSILDTFVNETAPPVASTTNAPAPPAKGKIRPTSVK